jgi:hypothetical protein
MPQADSVLASLAVVSSDAERVSLVHLPERQFLQRLIIHAAAQPGGWHCGCTCPSARLPVHATAYAARRGFETAPPTHQTLT